MQPIRYNVNRSSFYGRIEQAVAASDGLTRAVELDLGKRRGYARDVYIDIPRDDPHAFRSSWAGAERRFSARLRAAATVLRDRGIHGGFHATHHDGVVRLERVRGS